MKEQSVYEQRPKILIVDDERLNINVLNELLRDEYKIMVATTGKQALNVVKRELPDLILLDIMLPDMNGYAICRHFKNNEYTQNIPIIFITVRNNVEEGTLGFDLGAVDFISKPFNNAVVKARVRTHIKLKQKSDLLESLVSIDGLTEIPNRRAFEDLRVREWSRGRRTEVCVSALMVDVDMFKQFNDNYGHSVGDECLVRVAKALSVSVLRPGDFVARYGGEEFAAILSNTDFDGAMLLAERFRAAVAALKIPHAYSEVAPYITISVGVATAVPNADNSQEVLFAAADRMLYDAKQNGRNTVKGVRL